VTECPVEFAPKGELVLSLKVTEEQAVQVEEELRREGMLAS
jgi:ssRNA-specific RNase YbeY (16S rRNA maturation enzyme)